MKNKNFDSISKFSVPQSWIDSAMGVPQNQSKKKAVIFIGFRKYLAAVACLLTVIGLSVLVLFMNDNKVISKPSTETQSNFVAQTDSEHQTNDDNTQRGPFDNINPNDAFIIETTPDGGIIIRPTTSDSQTTDTTAPTSPTKSPTDSTIPNDPTENPTTSPTDDTKPISPTNPAKPSEPSLPPPDDPVYPTEPEEPWDPVEPWDPTDPLEPPGIQRLVASVTISEVMLNGNKEVYCKVYDSNGVLRGDPNLFSSQHKVQIIPRTDGNVTLYYEVNRVSIGIYNSYRFVYYDLNGRYITETTDYGIYY